MAEDLLEGGCQCGRIRYRATGEPIVSALCHCASCRRAHAAPAVAWVMYPESAVEFLGDPPTVYESTPGVRRGFCAACGSPVCFTADFLPGLVDLPAGGLDDPDRVPPTMHYWDTKRVAWLQLADDLPRHAEFPPMG